MIHDCSVKKELNSLKVTQFIFILIFYFCTSSNFAQTVHQIVDQQNKEKIINKISELLRDKYVFPDLGEKYGQDIISIFGSDKYDLINSAEEFAEKVTIDLQTITNDKHIKLRLIESSDLGEEKEGSLHHPVRLYRLIKNENLGFFRFDWLEGNIGYLDIRRFNSPAISKNMVVAAMNFVSGANAIIIDFRENQGGTTDILPLLCSYFFEYPTQLNSDYFREFDITKESWTTKEIVGNRLTDIPLFILTSHKTFSAAESFAFDMKVRNRAIIIGDSTGGGAHSVDLFKIDQQFEIYISTARSFNPVTGSNWERTGVIPDILVPAESALDTAIVLAKKEAMKYGEVKDAEMKEAVLKMQNQLDRADKLYQIGKDELAYVVLDSVFQIGIKAKLINEFFVQVLAYDYWSTEHEEILLGILKKYIEIFPDSYNIYEMLAWAHLKQGDEELAIQNFEKVLEIDPNNSLASQMLKKLKKK